MTGRTGLHGGNLSRDFAEAEYSLKRAMMAGVIPNEASTSYSTSIPAPTMYGALETVTATEDDDPGGLAVERISLVRSSQKYPLLRVEEIFLRDPEDPGNRHLLERLVMVAGHVLVKAEDGVDEDVFQEALASRGVEPLAQVSPAADLWRVAIPADSVDDLPEALAALSDGSLPISFAEPDYLVFHQQLFPDDPLMDHLWGLNNTGQTGGTPGADIDAPGAWSFTTGSSEVIVAVIDTGVDYLHPDLAGNINYNPGEAEDGTDTDGNGFADDVRGWNFHGEAHAKPLASPSCVGPTRGLAIEMARLRACRDL